jgi:hypothetical protein
MKSQKKEERKGLKDASKNIASIKLILYNFVKIQSRKNVYCKPNSTI